MRDDARRLARRQALLDVLGRPERDLRVVHVAGTNGKGSVAAMIASGLAAAGHRVALFTSPDLGDPRERFMLGGAEGFTPISHARLTALELQIEQAAAEVEATYADIEPLGGFELRCAQAWRWMAEERPDVAVVEAGIGARFDATNVFDRPLLAVIASVGMDHADRLGTDLTGIAREKAGAMREGGLAVTSARGVALDALRAAAHGLHARLDLSVPLDGRPSPLGGWDVTMPPDAGWPAARGAAKATHLPLAGRFQLENAGLAIRALALLNELGLAVDEDAARLGLAIVRWPGRMERVADPDGGDWLLDGAHNAPAVAALVESWGEPGVVVAGIQATKDAASMVPALTAGGRPLVTLPVPGAPASWSPTELAGWAAGRVYPAGGIEQALELARALAPGRRRCVTGSLYVVGAARASLFQGVG